MLFQIPSLIEDFRAETAALKAKSPLLKQVLRFLSLFLGGVLLGSCGYTFQNSRNTLYEKEGIQKIYVSPVGNSTLKGGVESLVYNNLVKVLVAHRKVTVVSHPDDADAILSGGVSGASFGGSATAPVSNLNPTSLGPTLPTSGYYVWTEYTATLSCSFTLVRAKAIAGRKSVIWSGGFTRSKAFPGANQLDVLGTTSPLINESEFDRALADLARIGMDDIHESMLAMF